MSGELELEFCPQGSLAERLRAGAVEFLHFILQLESEQKLRKEKKFVCLKDEKTLEKGITGEFAFVKASGDKFGKSHLSKNGT